MKHSTWFLAACLFATDAGAGCATFPSGYKVSAPLAISEIEAEELKSIRESGVPKVPQVPFGYQHQRWLEFKAAVRGGDTLVRFESAPASWRQLHGRAGYARMRSGCIEATLLTRMS